MVDREEIEKELGFSLTDMVKTLSKKQFTSLNAKVTQYENLVPVLEKADDKKVSEEGLEVLTGLVLDIKKQIELTEKQAKMQLELMQLSDTIEIKEKELNNLIKQLKK